MITPPAAKAIPAWLETPPSGAVHPPIQTAPQILPFDQLAWEDFERLCLRFARTAGDVEHAQLYGTRGQNQDGIDLYVRPRLGNKYRVYQCKRYKRLTASVIRSAAKKFLQGEWAERSDSFFLCASESFTNRRLAKEIEDSAQRLRAHGIAMKPLGCDELSEALREHPEIVHDFFGPHWLRAFLGEEVANRLRTRLSPEEVQRYRKDLREFCRTIFAYHDPGISALLGPPPQDAPTPLTSPLLLVS